MIFNNKYFNSIKICLDCEEFYLFFFKDKQSKDHTHVTSFPSYLHSSFILLFEFCALLSSVYPLPFRFFPLKNLHV